MAPHQDWCDIPDTGVLFSDVHLLLQYLPVLLEALLFFADSS